MKGIFRQYSFQMTHFLGFDNELKRRIADKCSPSLRDKVNRCALHVTGTEAVLVYPTFVLFNRLLRQQRSLMRNLSNALPMLKILYVEFNGRRIDLPVSHFVKQPLNRATEQGDR